MTWEYRVVHEVHEVPGGITESTYGIIEAYYAAPGTVTCEVPAGEFLQDATCSRCGTMVRATIPSIALRLAEGHRCPDVVVAWSRPHEPATGETMEELATFLVSDAAHMLLACRKPVLERSELPGEPPTVLGVEVASVTTCTHEWGWWRRWSASAEERRCAACGAHEWRPATPAAGSIPPVTDAELEAMTFRASSKYRLYPHEVDGYVATLRADVNRLITAVKTIRSG